MEITGNKDCFIAVIPKCNHSPVNNETKRTGCLKSLFSPLRCKDAKNSFIDFQFFAPLRLRGEERISDL